VRFRFERYVALRYLWGAEGREEGRSFLRFVTYVAIGGVTLGVAALLLSLTIVRGFRQEITNKIIGFGAHIQVQSYIQDEPLSNARSLQQDLLDVEGVAEAAPILEDIVLLRRSETAVDGVVLLGSERAPPYMEGRTTDGSFRLEPRADGSVPVVLGADLARRLQLTVGDRVTAFALRSGAASRSTSLRRPGVKQFTVRGIYETSLTDIDDTYVFTNLRAARDLLGVESGAVSRFDLRVHDVSTVDSLAVHIEDQLGFPIAARSIYQIQPFSSLFAWVDLQQSIIPLIIGVIVVVAAFNIIGTLLMMILEKTREIGVLQSVGASQRGLKRLFLTIGVFIGVVGAGIGSVTAFGLAYVQKHFQLIPLPAEAYFMSAAPIKLNPLDFLIVSAIAIALCGTAAYIPARVAARIEPVDAIRFN